MLEDNKREESADTKRKPGSVSEKLGFSLWGF